MSSDGIGGAKLRSEDRRLLTGEGEYTSDFFPANLCHAALVRSPHAHARIGQIDVSAAASAPGVLIVLTGADAARDGIQAIPHNPDWQGPPDATLRLPAGFHVFQTQHEPLPAQTIRYVGEAVALVIAETAALAAEAAELVDVDYDLLPAVTTAAAATRTDAPSLWNDRPGNVALTCEVGDEQATEAAFERAAHVVRFSSHAHRVIGNPMEPRAVVGTFDAQANRYTLRAASGRGAVQTRERLAITLGVDKSQCRVLFGDMGGNFGTRNAFSPEFTLMPWASRKVGRPVKWTADRSECFLTDYQARDLVVDAELALDNAGNFIGMRGNNTLNLGAYTVYFWPLRKGLSMMQGTYNIPCVHFRGQAVLTNTAPTAVYRSAGRPEAIYVIERLIELAASATGIDRASLRHRNLIPSNAMPFTNAVGVTYDSGDYAAGMAKAIELCDWHGFEQRRDESAARGLCRGIAIANYIEVTSGIPRERAEVRVLDDGQIELVVGTASSGQGHETSFPQLICEWLQVPFDRIRFIANDTNRVSVGGGSHSGRSMRLVSIAADEAVRELVAKGKKVAAHVLQTNEEGVRYAAGAFTAIDGATLTLAEATRASLSLASLPDDLRGGLEGIGDITNRVGGYPYGSHACEVEVDADTGHVEIVDWTAVDDVGLAVNPLILHGQAHGAATQGLGQALMESIIYDETDGQLITGSFMDYAMPRAITTPPFRTAITEVPASSHPHGIRPGGEGGTTPALGLVINAIINALGDYNVHHIDMPATPERVWRAIQQAKTG